MSVPPVMTIWECKKCKTRYGQKRGEELSSCPHCKSEERAPLAQPVLPVEAPSPDDYMDLWRFAQLDEERFLQLLEKTHSSLIAQCPLCDAPTFLHRGACWLQKMQLAEIEARRKQLEPGQIVAYTCEQCRGHLATLVEHYGSPQMFIPCRASMGCKGQMKAVEQAVPENPAQFADIKWRWRRPTEPEGLALVDQDHAVNNAGLILMRAPL